jgi:hypothetical protein
MGYPWVGLKKVEKTNGCERRIRTERTPGAWKLVSTNCCIFRVAPGALIGR